MIPRALIRLSLGLPLLALACLSSQPPAPPVRWFDPLPPPPPNRPAAGLGSVLVRAAPQLGREFTLRTGAREFAFDTQHQWTAEPRLLVATALAQALGGVVDGPRGDRELVAELEAFEFDLTAAPVARIRLVLLGGAARVVEAEAVAGDRTPPALAAAMAQALGEVVARAGKELAARDAAPR